MNKTHNNGTERMVEQVEVAPVHLAGLQAMGLDELAAVEGGSYNVSGMPIYMTLGGSVVNHSLATLVTQQSGG